MLDVGDIAMWHFDVFGNKHFSYITFFVLLPSSYKTFQVDALCIQDVVADLLFKFFVVRCFGFCDISIYVRTTISAL